MASQSRKSLTKHSSSGQGATALTAPRGEKRKNIPASPVESVDPIVRAARELKGHEGWELVLQELANVDRGKEEEDMAAEA
jgi:hypothetical protein